MSVTSRKLNRVCAISVLATTIPGSPAFGVDPAEDSLPAAFLRQCQHMQACVNAEMLSKPDLDPAMVQMIQSRMAGQCEAQLPKIQGFAGMPQAENMTRCYDAMAALSCAEIKSEPQLPECDF